METQRLILRILRVFYQGFRLITTGLKKEIDAIEAEEKETTTDDSPELSARPAAGSTR
jgi:hypothetical protein